MGNCDLCGKETNLMNVLIEGSNLFVCESCSVYGEIIDIEEPITFVEPPKKTLHIEKEEAIEYVRDDCGFVVKQARERKNLTQKELAFHLNERESMIHKIESGKMKPHPELSKKLEIFLNIGLIQVYNESQDIEIDMNDTSITIGDLIKIKKR